MKAHPYLKAYMAGITVPTMFLLVILTILVSLRRLGELPAMLEHFVVFPMAVVPNSWGGWNLLRVASTSVRQIPLGMHGALLAVVLPLIAGGVALTLGFELPAVPAPIVAVAWIVVIVVYYLVWKHLVRFLNELLGVSG